VIGLPNVARILLWVLFIVGGLGAGILIDLRHFHALLTHSIFHLSTFVPGLVLLALGLIVGSPPFLLCIYPIEPIVMLLIRFLEKREAVAKFGEAYLKYRQDVPMFSLSCRYLKRLFRG